MNTIKWGEANFISCKAQNVPKTSHLTHGKTKALTVASTTMLVKVQVEIDGAHQAYQKKS